MCTILLINGPNGHLTLAGNRDEQRSRQRALAPRIHDLDEQEHGTQRLFPVDGDAQGTWIGANAHGIVMTLLNGYEDDKSFTVTEPAISRGALIPECLKMTTLERALDYVKTFCVPAMLRHMRPFVLLMAHAPLDSAPRAVVTKWTGSAFHIQSVTPPIILVSSGVQKAEATAQRTLALSPFTEQPYDAIARAGVLRGAFSQGGDAMSATSVCMAREDARTVSFTRVTVSPGEITMHYVDGPPCDTDRAVWRTRLERSATAATDTLF